MKNRYPLALLWAGMFMAAFLVNVLWVHPAAVEQAKPAAVAAQVNPGAAEQPKPVAAEQAKAEAGQQAVKAAVAQAKFDPVTYSQNMLTFNLLVPIEKSLSVRLLYRYENQGLAL